MEARENRGMASHGLIGVDNRLRLEQQDAALGTGQEDCFDLGRTDWFAQRQHDS
jgi:hypothetical protein